MTFLTIWEIIDMIIISLAVGYIFKDMFPRAMVHSYEDYFEEYKPKFSMNDFKFAILVVAPAIILHEFGHKIAALAFGLYATFNAAYLWLVLGVVLKAFGSPILFFVPAYVAHSATAFPWQSSIIAFAGPFVNLVLWLGSWLILKKAKKLDHTTQTALLFTKRINMFLFLFNMIPIPPFDGGQVLMGLIGTFF